MPWKCLVSAQQAISLGCPLRLMSRQPRHLSSREVTGEHAWRPRGCLTRGGVPGRAGPVVLAKGDPGHPKTSPIRSCPVEISGALRGMRSAHRRSGGDVPSPLPGAQE